MFVSISGVQNSGKTTLISELKDSKFFKDFEFIPSFSTKIAKENINKHSENTNDEIQLQMLNEWTKIFESISTSKNYISDRSLFDIFGYTNYSFLKDKISLEFYEYILKAYKLIIPTIDFIFVLDYSGIPLENDNKRSMNPEYRNELNELFLFNAKNLENAYILDKNDRLKRIINIINRSGKF